MRGREHTRLVPGIIREERDAALDHPAADALADLQPHLARVVVDRADRGDDLQLVLVVQQGDRSALEGDFEPLDRAV